MDIKLRELMTPQYLVKEEKATIAEEAKSLVDTYTDFRNTISERLTALGLSEDSFWIQANSQEAWDKFSLWQKEHCESIILMTTTVELGLHLRINVIYKSKTAK